MRPLIGVDWGTSSLRVARFDEAGRVVEERAFDRGILTVAPGEFPAVFEAVCGDWMRQPVAIALVSGMAGSRQGWIEAPYCACPAGIEDVVQRLAWAQPGRVAIVPGLTCENAGVPDVMRGEETQVFGALELLGVRDATAVLPGTHSKWVDVREGCIQRFTTFMTGEIYALLSKHSILARTMAADEGDLDEPSFIEGLDHATRTGNLLQSAFSVRTLALFERLAAQAARSYLSGLVIGEELRARTDEAAVIVIGSNALTRRYELALRHRGIATQSPGDQAAWRGLWAIAQTRDEMQ